MQKRCSGLDSSIRRIGVMMPKAISKSGSEPIASIADSGPLMRTMRVSFQMRMSESGTPPVSPRIK